MTYISGTYFQICDICGFKKRNTETRINWKNQVVCADTCYERKHPQLNLRSRKDKQGVKHPRPEAEDTYLSTAYADRVTADDL
jgi:hypothetical protein